MDTGVLSESVSRQGSLLYIPSHPFYVLLHSVPGRYRFKVFYGGRGAAKSWSVAEALIRLASTKTVRVLCCREYQNSIKDSSHKLLKDTIARLGLGWCFDVTKEEIRSRTGSEFLFKGLWNNEESVKSTEGIDICWVEEAQTVSDPSWRTLVPTIRNPCAEIWVTYNLINEEDPTHQRFAVAQRDDCICQHVNYDQNPYFDLLPLKADMEFDRANNYHMYEHVWLGLPLRIDDSIIMSGKYIVEDFPDDLWTKAERLHFGADFGYAQDPSTLIRSFILPVGAGQDLFIDYEAYETGIENDEYDDFYKRVPLSHKWPIKADAAMPGLISHIRGKWGYNISAAEKWPGSIEDGIKYIRGFGKVHIHTRCKGMTSEARLYRYKVDRLTKEVLPVIIDKHNHGWDGLRYGHDGHILRSGEIGIWQRIGRQQREEEEARNKQ